MRLPEFFKGAKETKNNEIRAIFVTLTQKNGKTGSRAKIRAKRNIVPLIHVPLLRKGEGDKHEGDEMKDQARKRCRKRCTHIPRYNIKERRIGKQRIGRMQLLRGESLRWI